MRCAAFAYQSNDEEGELGALADAAQSATDRASAAISDKFLHVFTRVAIAGE